MSLRRYWYGLPLEVGQLTTVTDELFHHIFVVCRHQVGDELELLSSGQAYRAQVIEVKKKSAGLKVLDARLIPRDLPFELCLAVAVPKNQVLDRIVEKAVELGVHRFQLVCSDFSEVRDPQLLNPVRMGRLSRIIKNATQQTGRGDLMEIHSALSLASWVEAINRNADCRTLFFYEGAHSLHIMDHMKEVVERCVQTVWVLLGAEGGFSQNEVDYLKAYGIDPVSLGSQILRVETACVAALATINYLGRFWVDDVRRRHGRN